MSDMKVSVSPHIRFKRSTRNVMLDVIIALLPVTIASAFIFGIRALILVLISSAFSVLLEYVYEKIMKMKVTIGDLSAVVTGMLVALNVPVGMPIWQLLIGDIAAIIVAKMLFGGLGHNFMNPALVGRVVMMFSFTTSMTTFPDALFHVGNVTDAVSSATPLGNPALLTADFQNLFLGLHGGVIGETCIAALILGGLYLMIKHVISPIIPITYIGSVLLFSFLFGVPNSYLTIFAGGLFLGAIFMATDYVTSPLTGWGKCIYGIFIGLITAVIRAFGNANEGVTFAILIGNILVPYINEWTLPRPLGAIRVKKEAKQ